MNTKKCRDCPNQCTGRRCTACKKKERERAKRGITPRRWLHELLRLARKEGCRRRHVPCDLTTDQLVDLYEKQGGKCAVTRQVMTLESGNPLSASIDRVKCDGSYTLSNVVLVCRWVNTGRGTCSIERFRELVLLPLLANGINEVT